MNLVAMRFTALLVLLLPGVMPVSLGAQAEPDRHKVIIDTDMGEMNDDAFVLFMLANSDNIEALGAKWGQVVGMVVSKGMLLVGAGVGLGLVAALAASRFMAGLLYGVSAIDPLTFIGVPGVLCAVALLASFIPARRAASVDPMMTLRGE